MANSSEIMEHLLQQKVQAPVPMTWSFLAPNTKGLQNAAAILKQNPGTFSSQLDPNDKPAVEVAVFAAATESFSQKNLNCDIQTSLERFKAVIQDSKALGLRVRAYVSVVLGCPFEGFDVDPHKVAEIATDLLESGADEISLGDTTGMGTAPRTSALLKCMSAAGIRSEDIAMHFHDTYGQALANVLASLQVGITTFDASAGGLGGCPYAESATGNVATEDLVWLLTGLGIEHGVDLRALAGTSRWMAAHLGREPSSGVVRALEADPGGGRP